MRHPLDATVPRPLTLPTSPPTSSSPIRAKHDAGSRHSPPRRSHTRADAPAPGLHRSPGRWTLPTYAFQRGTSRKLRGDPGVRAGDIQHLPRWARGTAPARDGGVLTGTALLPGRDSPGCPPWCGTHVASPARDSARTCLAGRSALGHHSVVEELTPRPRRGAGPGWGPGRLGGGTGRRLTVHFRVPRPGRVAARLGGTPPPPIPGATGVPADVTGVPADVTGA